MELQRAGSFVDGDVIVLDKNGIGAGASGIACGVIRNNYFQPAIRELMAHSVSVWESDPEAFAFHGVGYMQIAPEVMHADVVKIYEEQRAIGYESVLVEGEESCRSYMQAMFSDWQAQRITAVLHEKRGGYANNMQSLRGLEQKAREAGARIYPGTRVTGLSLDGGSVTAVETEYADISCDHVVIAAGPWVRSFWEMLELPETVGILGRDGNVYERPMWTYWCLQEGTLKSHPSTS